MTHPDTLTTALERTPTNGAGAALLTILALIALWAIYGGKHH